MMRADRLLCCAAGQVNHSYPAVERLLPFNFGSTCQLVARRGEWAFFLRTADAGAEGVHLDIDFTDREVPRVLNPQRFTFPVGEGICLEMERLDGSEEGVTIWPESVEGDRVMIGLELPEGVTAEPFEDDDSSSAG